MVEVSRHSCPYSEEELIMTLEVLRVEENYSGMVEEEG